MPMLTHPPDAPELPTTHHVVTGRDGDGRLGSAAPRPEVLLPSGGSDQRGGPGAGVMGDAGFRLQVAAIHDQLIPIRSRVALASSYGREASRQRIERLPATVDGRPRPRPDRITPLQVAYAVRWLELGDPEPAVPPWPDLLDGPLD